MFRFNLTLSILVSIVFIGGAVWLRASQTNSANENLGLESVPNSEVAIFEGSPQDVYLGEKATSTQNLNQTDLLGRQLFSDYLNLSSQGSVTSEKINNLANSYADNILNLQTSSKIDKSSLTITTNSQATLSTYGTAVLTLRIRYGDAVQKLVNQTGAKNADDPKVQDLMLSISQTYKQAAQDLINMPVPQSLADNHLKLINNYLSSSEAARTIANADTDPMGAYAALNVQVKNGEEENLLLGNIQSIMAANGIIFSSSI
jgi:hypothetical protein